MYKKIKNGSFMNWIWFFISIAPILLVFIYSLSFFDNEEKKISYDDSIYNLAYKDNLSNFSNTNIVYNNEKYRFDIIGVTPNQAMQTYYPNEPIFTLDEGTYYIYFISSSNDAIGFSYLSFFDAEGMPILSIVPTSDFVHIYKYEYTITNTLNINGLGFYFSSSNAKAGPGDYYGIFISELPNLTYEDFDNGQFIKIGEIVTYNLYNSFPDYLTMIKTTIETNGFISNTFLNLAQFFGITNVYYSLACYYIEYLLIIILLHLAFDILYIVPNICHKFMEKIGGERD